MRSITEPTCDYAIVHHWLKYTFTILTFSMNNTTRGGISLNIMPHLIFLYKATFLAAKDLQKMTNFTEIDVTYGAIRIKWLKKNAGAIWNAGEVTVCK